MLQLKPMRHRVTKNFSIENRENSVLDTLTSIFKYTDLTTTEHTMNDSSNIFSIDSRHPKCLDAQYKSTFNVLISIRFSDFKTSAQCNIHSIHATYKYFVIIKFL